MRELLARLANAMCRFILWLRYPVKIEGVEEALKHPGPYLILPSHPAYIDPPNVVVHLWPIFKTRPMLLETNFKNPVLRPFAWLLRAIKVPETDTASAETRRRAEAAVKEVEAALAAGDNVVLWPTGTLSRDGSDRMGAARTAADVLREVPQTTVVLVRTRGLWGSSFSWARTGTKPKLTKELVRGAFKLLANLIFFAPRRRITLTIEAFNTNQRPEATREALNPWLEEWYNRVPDKLVYVPTHFLFGPRTYEFPPHWLPKEVDASQVKPAVREGVNRFVEEHLKRPLSESENQADASFASLGIDSLEVMEISLEVERAFGFNTETTPASLGEMWRIAAGLGEKAEPKPPPKLWSTPPGDTNPLEILGETIPEAFWHRARRHPKNVACADDIAGALNYEKLLIGVLTMAKRFRELPGDNVGLLLPASVAADISFLGLHFAGKTPIALNWTTGTSSLTHAVKITGLQKVITSKKFIDRTQIQVPGAEFVFLEEIRSGVGKFELIKRLIAVRFFSGILKSNVFRDLVPDPAKPAVVLFTSGSEKAPKAVPLTHANIIADLRGATPPQKLTRADSVLGFLPMFHSFGLTIAGLFPVLAGAKVVHHPDPTDSSALARKTAAYGISILIGTPTFLSFLFAKLKPGEVPGLRIVVVGAERCPEEFFDTVKRIAPQATVLEGYGVTECSPCVSVNPVASPRRGTIGQPLPNVKVMVRDLETDEPKPANEMGMLYVGGPTVFPGYIAHDGEQPFKTFDGEKWYVTGDLAALDADNYIVFHGRLKRFLKAGGEMISLPALEEPFTAKYPATDDGPRVAVEGIEEPQRRIVLFTTVDMSLIEANALLKAAGFSGILRLDEVRKIDAIPVLGTGKTDYKTLRASINESGIRL